MENLSYGDWQMTNLKECELPEKIATGLREATEKFISGRFIPLLYVATQVVAGTNHMIICEMVPANLKPVPLLVAVYLHEALPAYDDAFRLLAVKPIGIGI